MGVTTEADTTALCVTAMQKNLLSSLNLLGARVGAESSKTSFTTDIACPC